MLLLETAELRQQRFGELGALLARGEADGGTALNAGAVEQAFARRHGEHGGRFRAAAGLAEDHDLRGIAAEAFDVVAHPFERRDQVHHARDARVGEFGRRAEIGEMQIAVAREAMIHGDDHDVAEACELCAVVIRARCRSRWRIRRRGTRP